jgi:predicted nucleic acid-binding protein
MTDHPVVFFDLNIILDVLQKRDPFYTASAGVLAAAETGKVRGYIAAHAITTLYYLIKKDKSTTESKTAITGLLQFLQIARVDHRTIEQALNLDYRDFEDAVQMIAAVHCKADWLVTRNPKDYKQSLVTVIEPAALLRILETK